MAKGTFGLVAVRATKREERQMNKQIRTQLKNLLRRKRELIKTGQFTPDRRSFFNERESELKSALK